MGRIVTFVIGMSVLVAAAWYVLNRPAHTDPEAAAARQLENVHNAADRLEGDISNKADEIFEKTK